MLKYVIVAFLISACSTPKVSKSKTIKKKVNIPKTTLLKIEYDCHEGLITHDVFLKRTNYEGCKSTKVSFTDGKSISFKNFVDNGNIFTSFHSAFDNFIVMNKDFYEGGGHIVINPTGSHEFFAVQSRGTINISPDKKKILFLAGEDDFYVPIHELFSVNGSQKIINDLTIIFGEEETCTKTNCFIYPDFPKTFISDFKFVTNELIEGRKCSVSDRSTCNTVQIRYDRMTMKWIPDVTSSLIISPQVSIKGSGLSSTLYLSPELTAELRKVAPNFKQYSPDNYPSNIVQNYNFTKKQMISAVVGDFNGDGKLDVVIQGADAEGDVAYKITSSQIEYKVSLFSPRRGGAKTISGMYYPNSTWFDGMSYFTQNDPGYPFVGHQHQGQSDRCPYESLSNHIKADGDRTLVYCWKDSDLIWDGASGD